MNRYNNFYEKTPVCNVYLSSSDANSDNEELAQIGVENLLLPIVFLLSFSVMAIVVQLLHQRTARKNGPQQKSVYGRTSTLSLELNSVDMQSLQKLDHNQPTKSIVPFQSRQCSGLTVDEVKDEDVGVAEDRPPQDKGKGLPSSIAKGKIISADAVELDNEASYERQRSAHRFEELVEMGALDEFFARYQDIKCKQI